MLLPAVRGVWLIDPRDGVTPGLWIELSTNPPGTLTGLARTAWPSTAGKTLANYQAELNIVYRDLCSLPGYPSTLVFGQQPPAGYYVSGGKLYPLVCTVAIALSSLSPVTISDVTVTEGALKQIKVGG